MNRFSLTLAAVATGLTLATSAWAGPQYVDETGFAVSGYDVVSYFSLDQVAVGQSQPEPLKGRSNITAEHNGSTFAFATEENKAAFLANPAKYAPQYDGHCAYGVAQGGKVPGNPTLWRIVDDKLYLNITDVVVGFWEEDISGNINKSEGNWPKLEPQKASTNTIPKWSSTAPVN